MISYPKLHVIFQMIGFSIHPRHEPQEALDESSRSKEPLWISAQSITADI